MNIPRLDPRGGAFMPYRFFLGAGSLCGLLLLAGCKPSSPTADAATQEHVSTRAIPSGTRFRVALGSTLSSETANVGDPWHGTLTEAVPTQNGGMIAAGSRVSGVVAGVGRAQRGSRAMLDLAVRSIDVEGQMEMIRANSEAVVAGSPRARNLGAIAGGAAAGALVGKVVGDGHNSAVGGLVGGLAATGLVAHSKGYQVVLPDGLVMSFTVSQTVAMR